MNNEENMVTGGYQKPDDIIQEVKDVQDHIDRALRFARYLAESIARGKGGRETALAITKLQEAKHWLNEALVELGE